MARSITEIHQQIIGQIKADPVLVTEATSTSIVALWYRLAHAVAVCVWTSEVVYDLFRRETDEKIAAMKPHSLRWYALKAKAFQYGFNLVLESDYYNNAGIADTVIAASKIVAYAAVVEQTRGLRIKVARDAGTDLAPLSVNQLDAFKAYMARVKDAGVKLLITSDPADSIKGKIDVYYNPLVLNSNGGRNDGVSADPVREAFKLYLKNLPFNGVFVLQNLVDVLQAVDGVKIIDIKEMQAKYGALAYTAFRVEYLPDAGYLRIYNDADLELTFIPYSE